MKYQGSPNFTHAQQDKIGVLVTNLGTPDAPTKGALKTYLKEFLSDPRVVEVPRLLWWFILNGVILRFRPKRSAAAYKTVWTDQGSPLLWHTKAQADALRHRLQAEHGDNFVLEFAMRYGNPSIPSVLESMFQQGVRKLVVVPLYPHYSASTTASTFDKISQDFTRRRWLPELRFVTHYHDYPPFIQAAASRIQAHWNEHGRTDKLLFSYHGVPLRYLKNGDPYHCECHKTSRLIASALQLQPHEYMTTFQSRFGREPWLQPYTDETMKALPGQGVKSVQVFCPGFSADCLETIEEIGEENREYFIESGGERYEYIPALNDSVEHIDALYSLIQQQLHGWQLEHDTVERAARAAGLDGGTPTIG
ncbi:ferrochelatase [Pseudidiomarina planktonica]|uniref:Ferrochelatase n=1 Tax=Pseudidiomarina planktonica TaxID=1323738 RepID=A0A1Y6EZL9_9GAMM|nr:ferrochelatase [Pseudidiomarina planktonica]RUO65217.1 ferrochelatase [Pseudidiomarina planktonica]SMQ65972.1 ferrochelatase [Pseudidiomarina planktonica]